MVAYTPRGYMVSSRYFLFLKILPVASYSSLMFLFRNKIDLVVTVLGVVWIVLYQTVSTSSETIIIFGYLCIIFRWSTSDFYQILMIKRQVPDNCREARYPQHADANSWCLSLQELLHHHGHVHPHPLLLPHWCHPLWEPQTRRGRQQTSEQKTLQPSLKPYFPGQLSQRGEGHADAIQVTQILPSTLVAGSPRIVTGEDWNRVLHDCMQKPPACYYRPGNNTGLSSSSPLPIHLISSSFPFHGLSQGAHLFIIHFLSIYFPS